MRRTEGGSPTDAEVLARVLERAQRVAVQLEDDGEDSEIIGRQCVQEMEMNRCMSVAGWRSGCDSDDDGDVANLDDLRGLSPQNSPPSSPSNSPPGSPPSSP